jgi:hypothetical protein
MTSPDVKAAIFGVLLAAFFIYCLLPGERARLELPFRILLLALMVLLFILQTTVLYRFPISGVRLELLPPLILFVALTTNFSMTVAVSIFAAILYDTLSPGRVGISLLPYVIGGGIFSVIRPMLYRNSWLTRFVSGWTITMIILFGQWIAYRAAGMLDLPFWHVMTIIFKLSLYGGILAIIYFVMIDVAARMLDLLPPQEGEIQYGRLR